MTLVSGGAAAQQTQDTALIEVAQSQSMIWNAVVEEGASIFVAGPRWAGGTGPQLARIVDGRPVSFPDDSWNSWKPGEDPSHKFVNINALHRDPEGRIWAVDTGAPEFGGDPIPGAAKLVVIDPAQGKVLRIVRLPANVAQKGSYVDDIRFNGTHAYLTDAGKPGLIVLDLVTGQTRRVLDGAPSTVAGPERNIVVDGKVLNGPDGRALRVHSDPLEVTPDGQWLLFGPLEGPWSRVPTRVLDDPALRPDAVAAAVEPFADLPPMGGSVMDADGNLYFSSLADHSIRKRTPAGVVSVIIQDPRLHWVDAMFITKDGRLLMPAAQLDRVGLFNGGRSWVQWPVSLFALDLHAHSEN
ncbi:L-dopachrome tautomerase-related protein [Sphingomonas kyeonggiensis]|uniref:Sugar lactone lactonase YvrE n=1 Tax=Sphingomonas kyeonggiensis TaxID=1268553 RepID=A0A7W6NVY3_9SPHN|nr:L-dopachrome tautomerase-related protein [Sphingomonas kyeonggiensis]MBB4097957.1 sugar lactone lactonase YvrE [Sphingomonas kyeonggiensis]